MRLYHRWKCPWCAAARQGIENVGADVELVEVPYPREERTGVLGLSGQSRVPVLVDGDEVIVDSRRIVRHLYERYGGERFARSAAELAAEEDLTDPEGFEELDACLIGPPSGGGPVTGDGLVQLERPPAEAPAVDDDDARLIEALRCGDEDAFSWLVRRHHGPLLRYAGVFCRDRAVAEEVVQETWLGVIRGIGTFEGRSSLKTWIFHILANRARTRGERESRSVPFSALVARELEDDEPAVDPDRFLPRGRSRAGRAAGRPLRSPGTRRRSGCSRRRPGG